MKNKIKIIVSSIAILIPMIYGLLVYDKLPSEIATHFNMQGVADGYSSKAAFVFGIPLFMLAMHLFVIFYLKHDPKKRNQSPKLITLMYYFIPVLANLMCLMTYLYTFEVGVNITTIVMLFVGVLFIVIGNYLPKTKQNYTMGIKTPWSLNDEENWNKTHRFGGICFIISGFVMILGSFIDSFMMVTITIVIMSAFLPMIYSYLLYKKG